MKCIDLKCSLSMMSSDTCVHACHHHPKQGIECFHPPASSSCPVLVNPSTPTPAAANFWLLLPCLPLLICHTFVGRGVLLLNIIFLYPSMMWSILIVCSLFYGVILHCMTTTEFVYPFSCFWTYGLFLVLVVFFPCLFLFWADMNTAVVNILTQVYMWTYVFKFFLDKYLGVKCLGHKVDICL